MSAKRKIHRESLLSQFIFGFLDPDETQEVEVQQFSTQKIFVYVAFSAIAVFITIYLIKVIAT